MHNASLPTIRQLPNHELYKLKLVHQAQPTLLVAVLTQKAIDLGVRFDNDRKDFQLNLSEYLSNNNGHWARGANFDRLAENIDLDLSDRTRRSLVADLMLLGDGGGVNPKQRYDLDKNIGLVDYMHPEYRETYFQLGTKPPSAPIKTIVLCFDGTTNHFSHQNTNVVKFVELLKKDSPEQQMVYYQTGVGTYTSPAWTGPISQAAAKVADIGVAWYLYQHIIDGYKFLMESYQAGDHIYIFGFSRGAFTARALAGMLHCVGLLPKHNIEHAPFAYEIYSSRRHDKGTTHVTSSGPSENPHGNPDNAHKVQSTENAAIADVSEIVGDEIIGSNEELTPDRRSVLNPPKYKLSKTTMQKNYGALGIAGNSTARDTDPEAYKQTFCTPVMIDLVGVWDTVASVGVVKSTDLSYIDFNPSIRIFRQALALDERRANFIPSLWDHSRKEAGQNIREVWFRGEHTDIGGGAPPPNLDAKDPKFSALGNITLRWMLHQCLENNTTIMFDYESTQLYREESVLEYRLPRSLMDDYRNEFHNASEASSMKTSSTETSPKEQTAAEQVERLLQLPDNEKYKPAWEIDSIDVQHAPYETMGVLSPWWILDLFPYNRHAKGWLETFKPNLGRGRAIQSRKDSDPIFIHASVVEFLQTTKGKGYVPRATWHGYQGKFPHIDSYFRRMKSDFSPAQPISDELFKALKLKTEQELEREKKEEEEKAKRATESFMGKAKSWFGFR